MYFRKEFQTENNPDGKHYSVYMELSGRTHYVCDLISDGGEDAASVNNLGLTLRARLTRSKGSYAMLEGEVFNPNRLLEAACDITAYSVDPFIGGKYKDGYTLLTVTADGCVNKYLVFSEATLKTLVNQIKKRVK